MKKNRKSKQKERNEKQKEKRKKKERKKMKMGQAHSRPGCATEGETEGETNKCIWSVYIGV
jgi:hypothetical protein